MRIRGVVRRKRRSVGLLLRVALLALGGVLLPSMAPAQNWVLTGQVVGTGGVGLPDVDIDLRPAAGGTSIPLGADLTGPGGFFTVTILEMIPPGDYDISFDPPPGHMGATVQVTLSGSTDVGVITLPFGWIISGQLVDGSGAGIEGVDIDMERASNCDGGGGNAVTLFRDVTLAGGGFAFTMPPVADTYRVLFDPIGLPGLWPVVLCEDPIPLFFGDTDLGVITMPPGWILSGRIVDENGVGIPQIDMNVEDALGVPVVLNQDNTDVDGFYSVLLPEGVWNVLFRQVNFGVPEEYVPVLLEDFSITADTTLPDITLFFGHHLTGTVEDPQGQPVAGAKIDVIHPTTFEPVHTPGNDADLLGDFDVLVPAGDWDIHVSPPPGPLLVAQSIPITVVPGGPNSMGTVLLPDGVLVSGVAVDAASSPVAGVDLDFVISSTQGEVLTPFDDTDQNGLFAVVVEPDTYDIRFRPPFATGVAPRILEATVVSASLDLGNVVLPAGFAITGTVTASGTPLARVELSLTDSASGAPVFTFDDETDTLGHYAVRQIAGTYDLLFTPPAGSGLDPQEVLNVAVTGDVVIDVDLGGLPSPPPVASLTCVAVAADVTLTWVNGAGDYDAIEVRRDGTLQATLAGTAVSYSDPGLADGLYEYEVTAIRAGLASTGSPCGVVVGAPVFIRGDANLSSVIDLADVITILTALFGTGSPLPCLDAADVNDDGSVDISDAIYELSFLFISGDAPPPPHPVPGPDPTADPLGCG